MSRPTNLVTLRPGVTFQADAAASFQRVEKRAGRRVDVNSTYRDWEEQMRLYLAYQRDPKNNPLALHPDHSMHCRGLALDSDDHTLMRSMDDYGWRATVQSEPWHFDYFHTLDKHYGQPSGGGETPLPTPDPQKAGDTVMRTIFIEDMKNPDDSKVDKRQRVLVGEFTYQPMVAAAAKVEYGLWGPPENIKLTEALSIRARVDARRASAGLKPLP